MVELVLVGVSVSRSEEVELVLVGVSVTRSEG